MQSNNAVLSLKDLSTCVNKHDDGVSFMPLLQAWTALVYAVSFVSGASIRSILLCRKRRPTKAVEMARSLLIHAFVEKLCKDMDLAVGIAWLSKELGLSQRHIADVLAVSAPNTLKIVLNWYALRVSGVTNKMMAEVLEIGTLIS